MAQSFLNETGLSYLISKIKTALNFKVDKVDGKGLSTNDYTDEDKLKLEQIDPSGEENILEGIQMNGVDIPIDSNKKSNIQPIISDVNGLQTQLNSKVNTNNIVVGINKDATGYYFEVNV